MFLLQFYYHHFNRIVACVYGGVLGAGGTGGMPIGMTVSYDVIPVCRLNGGGSTAKYWGTFIVASA